MKYIYGLIIINILFISNKLNFLNIIYYQIFLYNFFSMSIFFFLLIFSILVETNRPPADLPESESELVAGYLVEYSSLSFAYIYLSEYTALILYCYLINILLFGGFNLFFLFIAYITILIRATFPRLKTNVLLYLWMK